MQVFLLLLDASGKVVTRNDFFDQCWGRAMVGDPSLNRTIVKLRSAGARVAPGFFEIETIPRTGYRITGEILAHLTDRPDMPLLWTPRRTVLASVTAAAALGAGGMWWWAKENQSDPRFAALLARGKRNLVDGWPGTQKDAVATFQKAVALQPTNAEAWGLLAFAYVNASGIEAGARAGAAAQAAERAARSALAIDPKEPNALLAMIALQRGMRDALGVVLHG